MYFNELDFDLIIEVIYITSFLKSVLFFLTCIYQLLIMSEEDKKQLESQLWNIANEGGGASEEKNN